MTSVNDKLENLLAESRAPRDIEVETISLNFHRTQLADFVLYLLLGTKEAQEKAVSYRSFNVAAGMLAVRPGLLGTNMGRFYGVNVKVDETDTINIHAEDMARKKARSAQFSAISVVAVIGPTQQDHASGLHTHALHPCGRCRDRLSHDGLIKPDTLFVSATEDFTVIDVSSLEGIKRLHEDGDESGIATFKLNDSVDLFTPLKELEAKAPIVEEVDDSEWQATVGGFLVRRFIQIQQNLL